MTKHYQDLPGQARTFVTNKDKVTKEVVLSRGHQQGLGPREDDFETHQDWQSAY